MRRYLFVDGNAFEEMIKNRTKEFPAEEITDVISFERFRNKYSRIFYYDTLPIKKPGQSEEDFLAARAKKEKLFRTISLSTGCHVLTGQAKPRKSSGTGMIQKGVDILLAIQVMQNAYIGNMDEATIFANDLDFFPIFDALTATRVNSVLLYDPGKTSEELIASADRAEAFHYQIMYPLCQPKYVNFFTASNCVAIDPAQSVPVGEFQTKGGKPFDIRRIGSDGAYLIDVSGGSVQSESLVTLREWADFYL